MHSFHLQARKTNLWTLGFIVSPFVSPFLLGYVRLISHCFFLAQNTY